MYRTQLSTLDFAATAEAYATDINYLNSIGFFLRTFEVDGRSVWEGLCMQAGRLVASSSSARSAGLSRCLP